VGGVKLEGITLTSVVGGLFHHNEDQRMLRRVCSGTAGKRYLSIREHACLEITDSHLHIECCVGGDVAIVRRILELIDRRSEVYNDDNDMETRTFELTMLLELGMSPIGVGLQDPPVTCSPFVIVLP
jgi:hypothetical protein